MRVDENVVLEKLVDFTNLLVEKFSTAMKSTGGDASYLNGKYEQHNRSIHNMVI